MKIANLMNKFQKKKANCVNFMNNIQLNNHKLTK